MSQHRLILILIVFVTSAFIFYFSSSSSTTPSTNHHGEDTTSSSSLVRTIDGQREEAVSNQRDFSAITSRNGHFASALSSSSSVTTTSQYYQNYFGVQHWSQLSISNPVDRFHFPSTSAFETHFQDERNFFLESLAAKNDDYGSSSASLSQLMRANTSFSYCSVPTKGKSVLNSVGKYNMRAELCWRKGRKIPSSSSSLSRTRKGCLGVVRISKKNPSLPSYCETTNSISISKNKTWANEILRRIVGPLHLRLLLEGPEVVTATTFFDHSSCEYWLHFYVQSPGLYGINFKFVHDDFWGVDETSHRTKHNLNAYCFPRSLPMLKCEMDVDDFIPEETDEKKKEDSQQKQVDAHHLERWVQRPKGISKWANRNLIANTLHLAPFSNNNNNKFVIGVEPRAVPPYGVAKLATKDNAKYSLSPWLLTTKNQDEHKQQLVQKLIHDYPVERWLDAEELIKIAEKRNGDENNNHKPKKSKWIFVMGDSQSRSITWSLKNYLQTAEIGRQDADDESSKKKKDEKDTHNNNNNKNDNNNDVMSYALRDKKTGKKISKSSDTFLDGKWKVSFMWDSALDLLIDFNDDKTTKEKRSSMMNSTEFEIYKQKQDSLVNADVLVAQTGHHLASWLQWSFEEFYQKSQKIASSLCQLISEKKKTVFWYSAPSWPKAKLVDNFRGTNQRLAVFNGLMMNRFEEECTQKRGIKIVLAGDAEAKKKKNVMNSNDEDFSASTGSLYIVDFYGITNPVMKHSKDGSHYDGTVVVATTAHKVFKSLV